MKSYRRLTSVATRARPRLSEHDRKIFERSQLLKGFYGLTTEEAASSMRMPAAELHAVIARALSR
jgi:hypothetical protein